MARITIRGLTKRYGAPRNRDADVPPALADLDLDIADGELLVIVGPSGCGKSTALRLIAGLEQPDRGTIELAERDLAGVPPQDRDIAMVFQGYALYPHLRVRDIIGFPLKMQRVARPERERRVAKIAEMVGLGGLLERRPAELSGGEQQRVAMARAIVRSPKAFLFDEPLSNLDAKLRTELRVELSRLVRRLGVTSLYVTHDQAEAMTMGDRVAVLRAGRLQQVAPPREIYEQPANAFVAGFLGTPAINLLELECASGQGRAGSVVLPLPGELGQQRRLTVGIRPEHLRLLDESLAESQRRVSLQAEVLNVEPLGAETFVHLDAGGTPLRARIPGLEAPAVGDQVTATLELRTLVWFDAQSGQRIDVALATDAVEDRR